MMMYKEGFLKVSTISPNLKVGDPKFNVEVIKKEIIKHENSSLIVFPELSLAGYTSNDLFYREDLINESLSTLEELVKMHYKNVLVVGLPLIIKSNLYNAVVVIQNGDILGIILKNNLVDNSFINESRWFKSGNNLNIKEIEIFNKVVPLNNLLFKDKDNLIKFGIVFNDNLKSSKEELYLNGANLIINLSNDLEYLGLEELLINNAKMKSSFYEGAYLYLSSGTGESSADGVYLGRSIHAVNGKLLKSSLDSLTSDLDFKEIEYKRRKENKDKVIFNNYKEVNFVVNETNDYYFDTVVDELPFLSNYSFKEVRNIQTTALKRRVSYLNNTKIVLGTSGGLDSTLALLVAYDTFKIMGLDTKKIISVIMPSKHTSKRTYSNALKLSQLLNVTIKEINIDEETSVQLKSIKLQKEDTTYENVQARIRTQTLMNLANKESGIVLGTGNLSEIALGFMTYNADQMSMYAVNAGLSKTMIQRHVKEYISLYPDLYEVLVDILNTPISPELKDNQETEEIVGSYLINDFLIYRYLASGDSKEKLVFLLKEVFSFDQDKASQYVSNFIKRFHSASFKRQVIPEGPRVSEISLNPRNHYKVSGDI